MQTTNLQPAKAAEEFINKKDILKRIPISDSTLSAWMRMRAIPFIKQRKRVLFHWPSVEKSLVEKQKNNL